MSLGLDVRTLCLIMVFLSGTYCIGLIIKQRNQAPAQGTRSLFYAVFFLMAGFSLLSFGDDISFWLSKVAANFCIALGFALVVLSLHQIRHAPLIYPLVVFSCLPLALAALIYYSVIEPSTNARVVVISVYATLCTVSSAIVVNKNQVEDLKLPIMLLTGVLIIHSLFMLFRIWCTLREPNIGDFLHAGNVHQLAIIMTAILLSTLGFTYNWILNARLMESLYSSSLKDSLTQLYNRRAMNEMTSRELTRSLRHKHALSVIILDIDHFKQVNDVYGHQVGDRVLHNLGEILINNLRAHDVAFRYGGEEFLIMLPDTAINDACTAAEKLKVLIESHTFWKQQEKPLTASFGVAQLHPNDQRTNLIERADKALYHAKEQGRNTVCKGEFEGTVSA
ncbi:GGDEF domain-containing protein [Vibrio sp. ED004]|nr:GGDEF domain-containing protein [Vibrio sp. ED004]